MRKISVLLIIITSVIAVCCQFTDEEEVINIRVYGYVRDKETNNPLSGCNIYIENGYIAEDNEYSGETDTNGYYEFNKNVWKNYATDISTFCDLVHIDQTIHIDNQNNNEVNFYLEKY